MALTKKNIKVIVKVAIVLIIVVLIYMCYRQWKESTLNTLRSKINKTVSIGEFSSLEYHYTSVESYKDPMRLPFLKLPIPLPFDIGYKKLFYSVDGIIKLGFNADDIKFDVSNNKITLKMPEIKILSHEVDLNTFKLFDTRSEWLFNELKSSDYYHTRTELKKNIEEEITKDSEVYTQARGSAQEQFEIFIEGLPGIKDKYRIEFKWE